MERGLSMLEGEDADSEPVIVAELGVRTVYGVPLMLTQGFASPGVAANYNRLLELCETAGASADAQLFPALWGLWTFYEVGGQLPKAEDMGRRLLELAERTGDSGVMLGAQVAYGAARLRRGDLAAAREHFEAELELYDIEAHAHLAMLFGQDGGAMCASFLTWVRAHDGEYALGERRAAESVQMAEKLNHIATWGFVEAALASFHCLLGQWKAVVTPMRPLATLNRVSRVSP